MNNSIVEVNDKIKFKNKFFSLDVSEAIKERAEILNHPKLWKLVLEKYPNLYLNFAHFGGSSQVLEYINYQIDYTKVDDEDFNEAICHLDRKKQDIVKSAYTINRGKMILKDLLTISERAKVWNVLYEAGIIDNWAKAIFEIIRNPKFPNAYTDLSCFSDGILIHDPENHDLSFSIRENIETFKHNFFDHLSDYEKSKILYGSDYFLTQFFGPKMDQYFEDFTSAFADDFKQIAFTNPKRFLNR